MNKIKNILLQHFNNYTGSHEHIYKEILLIIVSFCTPYYEPLFININFKKLGSNEDLTGSVLHKEKKYITVVKSLTKNRIGFGLFNGTICILNLTNNHQIIRQHILSNKEKNFIKSIKFKCQDNDVTYYSIKNNVTDVILKVSSNEDNNFNTNSITKICQIDDNVIVYTIKSSMSIFVWNFEKNDVRIINNDVVNGDIILLKKNTIAFVTDGSSIKLINIDTNEIRFIECLNHHYPIISVLDNKIILNSNNVLDTNKFKFKSVIEIIDKNDFITNHISENENNIYYEKEVGSWYKQNIITCKNNLDSFDNESKNNVKEILLENYLIIVEYPNGNSFLSTILLYNIQTKKNLVTIDNIQSSILSVIYLNNGYIAILIKDEIIIYSLVTKLQIQIIKFESNNFISLESIHNGKFLVIIDGYNVTMYE